MSSLIAELMLIRKRVGFWVLLGFWAFDAILFSYILPYYAYTSDINFHGRGVGAVLLFALLPQNLVANISNSFPFFGGTIVLILGALAMGSEYNWGTLTPVFTQRAGRLKVFFSKLTAIAITLIPFVLVVFALAFTASLLISWGEGVAIEMPPVWDVLQSMSAAWFLLAVWASFGILLAVLSRGTALAIGMGIIYGLVFEGIISSFGRQIELLATASKGLLRTNGYSLISSLGASLPTEQGPGAFSGESVSGGHAAIVLAVYLVLFVAVSAVIVRWRDVAGAS